MSENAAPSKPIPDDDKNSAGVRWFLVSALAIAVLTLISVHAPNRLKTLGLFAFGFGLIGGWITAAVANHFRFSKRRAIACFTAVLLLCGLIGKAAESHRLYVAAINQEYSADPTGFLKDQLEKSSDSSAIELQELIDETTEERQGVLNRLTSFRAYLQFRTSSGRRSNRMLGAWPEPWPMVLFLAELLIGTVAGVVISIKLISPSQAMDEKVAVN